jgi:site-specific recombinase XerC
MTGHFQVLCAKYVTPNGGDIMRIIPTPCPNNDAALLDAFRQHLADRDLAPATVQAYLSDLARFQAWLTWAHDDQAPLLTQVRTVDLAAFRTHLIHEQVHPPATVNRRLQGLRLFFYWLAERNGRVPAGCGKCFGTSLMPSE